MIKEIYIDNFRCLVNFRIKPEQFQLWLGNNGVGKTSVFDALRKVQRLMRGEHIQDIFSKDSLTIWDTRNVQSISLILDISGDSYKYELKLEHLKEQDKLRIKSEKVFWNEVLFFNFDGQEAHLFRINRDTKVVEEGAYFPAGWDRSVIPTIADRDDNKPLICFRKEIEKILLVNPIPLVVKNSAETESQILSRFTENFAQWYRHLSQENPSVGHRAKAQLEDVLPGFSQLSLKQAGESRKLIASFRIENKDHDFEFMKLSDGQRQLIILYVILEALRAGICSTLLIDEPDNFVAIREIQPWLKSLRELCDENDQQSIIVSHHPEIINDMARGNELWFSRKSGAHVIAKEFPKVGELPPSEIMARGWEDE